MAENAVSFVQGNAKANAAICTLWSPAGTVANALPQEKFSLCANLYSLEGINTVARGILANPLLRYVIIFGSDLTHTGETLKSFFEGGIGEKGKVKGSNFSFQPEIPLEALEKVRKNVKLYDLRGKSVKELAELLDSLPELPAFAEPKEFPFPETPHFDSFDSEGVGFLVRAKNVSAGWLKLLDLVMKFGEEKQSEYPARQKELLSVLSVIDEEDKTLPSFLGFTDEELKKYIPSIMSAEKPASVSYTYGSRIFRKEDAFNENQVESAISHLRKSPHTRRAIAFTWRHDEDMKSENPPCLTQISWNVRKGKLFQACVFRSHDIFSAWPMNLFALRELQKKVASELSLPPGSLSCLSVSAHIYENKWQEAKKIIEEKCASPKYLFREDPRGNFLISIAPGLEGRKIVLLQHFTPDGRKTQFSFHSVKEGEKQIVEDLTTQVLRQNLVSRPDHAMYLGKEIQRALGAIRDNKEYVQDSD